MSVLGITDTESLLLLYKSVSALTFYVSARYNLHKKSYHIYNYSK